jgi:NADPH-dependent curcumin reductase CurA
MSQVNRQIVLASRPKGEVTPDNFRLVEAELAPLADGQVRVRNHFLSLDPYMRGRMNDSKSYAASQPLDEVMIGGTVGEVVESKNPHFAVGDKVVGMGGWQEYQTVDASQRVTAWYGLVKIINPKAGETVVVSAASGAVGSVVGQLAKARGCRAVGLAGGADKCRYVVEELGFDACIDYKQHPDVKSLSAALKAECPNGIDGYFENVGGMILDAVLLRANAFSRVAMCGMISGYDGQPIPMAAPQLILVNRMKVEGFIVSEHMDVWPDALKELGTLVATGKLKYRESIAEGIASAPEAFMGLLKGKNFGKQLVKLI